jgi:hypothetical protein
MRRKSTLEKPDSQFIALADTIHEQCGAHVAEWKLDPERMARFTVLLAAANTAYAANSDRATRNMISAANKKAAFTELKRFLSLFIDYLIGNLSVPDEALVIMSLRSRTPRFREPLPKPVEAPLVLVDKQHDEMTVSVARAEYGHPTHSATLRNYRGFKLRWRFEDETDCRIELSTRLRFTLRFNRTDETRRVILAAAWVNPRLEEGPWSEDLVEIVG